MGFYMCLSSQPLLQKHEFVEEDIVVAGKVVEDDAVEAAVSR